MLAHSSSGETDPNKDEVELVFTDIHRVDHGTFGTIFRAYLQPSGQKVAIKKVAQHSGYYNRELQVIKELDHPNIVTLMYHFYTRSEDQEPSKYLNLVMEFIPSTVGRLIREYRESKQPIPIMLIKIITYQMFRALMYLHNKEIGHRDIKPQNLLYDPITAAVKLCDFGCAKVLRDGETSISYICSRYYRAPELCLGATSYTVKIDIWSSGCVFAELFLGEPLFRGDSREDQLAEIVRVLGSPTREQLVEMKVDDPPFPIPEARRSPWAKAFRHARTPVTSEALELCNVLMRYTPSHRASGGRVIRSTWFSELRDPTLKLPNGSCLPPLFNFSDFELAMNPYLSQQHASKVQQNRSLQQLSEVTHLSQLGRESRGNMDFSRDYYP
ncbi:unnamed protein product [Cyprideis torosa]|uniref:Uncharacterized protein n=1 Tax=Cyprideis torosa TaxID=163714 RepID=A0A7R8WIC8_9CRUS|nr:unnamed protein product [Cyprideis torosa]CAG0900569.1 unnamed protein product [Cyprideis torosa]